MINSTTRSPLKWIGGKYHSAERIVKAFPAPSLYDTYVEPCGGAAHVLFAKPAAKHREVFNDINGDLVNFWLQCRDNLEALTSRLQSLPYARAIYYTYYRSLFDGSEIEPLERAVRWFYVLRSTGTGWIRKSPVGWNNSDSNIISYRMILESFQQVQRRMARVMIDNRDIRRIVEVYDSPRTLFYIDPPYIGAEHYYNQDAFDHEGLSQLLQHVKGSVALSYYPHNDLESWYPVHKWRRITWEVQKVSAIHGETPSEIQTATEMLLCNYPEAQDLWQSA